VRLGMRARRRGAWDRCTGNAAGRDGDIGGLGGGRRADLVLVDDTLKPQSTWYGGELVVKDRAITPVLEKALTRRYQYPKAAYTTVKVKDGLKLVPEMPKAPCIVNAIRTRSGMCLP
jgi:adenine deaminase